MLGGKIPGDELEDLGVHFEPGQVHRRHAVLPGQDLGHLDFLHQSKLHQDIAQPETGSLLLLERLRQLLAGDQSFPYEDVTKPITAGGRGCHRLGSPEI